jgi:hypothetical protein
MPRITRKMIAHVEHVANILNLPSNEAWALRKAALTLHRWFEQECGDSNDYCSWCITRDESGKPFREISSHMGGKNRMEPIRDMEAGARRRIDAICKRNGLHYYIQGDCRGGTLYLSRQPIPENSYTSATFLA